MAIKTSFMQYQAGRAAAVFSPKTSILIQKRTPYTGTLNSQKPGDSENTFLHYGDVSGPA